MTNPNLNVRYCPQACKPGACFCKLKPAKSNYDPTPCEEKENNGIAGFYDDIDDNYGRDEFSISALTHMTHLEI